MFRGHLSNTAAPSHFVRRPDRIMRKTLPINEEDVDDVLATLSSPVAKNLLRVAVATARTQFVRKEGETEQVWGNRLRFAEFDMGFFARVIAEAFCNEDMLRAVLDRESIEEASGWKF